MKTVFIGGVDRSGTTLLGSLLATIPEAVVTPESIFKTSVCTQQHGSPEQLKAALSASYLFAPWEISDLSNINLDDPRQMLEDLVTRYAGRQPSYWIDHTPNNLQHARYLKTLFPDAKFLHIVRDGRAVASSVLPLEWGPNTALSCARNWVHKLAFGLAAQAAYPECVKLVRFEDLVSQPVETLNDVFRFLGEDIVLERESDIVIAGNIVPSITRFQHEKVGQLPDKSMVDKWKTKLRKDQVRDFEYIAGHMLELLGYPREEVPSDLSTWYRSVDAIKHLFLKKTINLRRFKKRRGMSSGFSLRQRAH